MNTGRRLGCRHDPQAVWPSSNNAGTHSEAQALKKWPVKRGVLCDACRLALATRSRPHKAFSEGPTLRSRSNRARLRPESQTNEMDPLERTVQAASLELLQHRLIRVEVRCGNPGVGGDCHCSSGTASGLTCVPSTASSRAERLFLGGQVGARHAGELRGSASAILSFAGLLAAPDADACFPHKLNCICTTHQESLARRLVTAVQAFRAASTCTRSGPSELCRDSRVARGANGMFRPCTDPRYSSHGKTSWVHC